MSHDGLVSTTFPRSCVLARPRLVRRIRQTLAATFAALAVRLALQG